MSHYGIVIFSREPYDEAFDQLLAPYDEGDSRYFVQTRVTDEEINERWNKFSKWNPSYTFEEYLKAYSYKKDDDGYYYESNPNGKYDWYTLDGKQCYEQPKWHQKYDNDAFRYRKSQLRFDGPVAFVKGLYRAVKSYFSIQKCDFYSDEYKNKNKNFIRYIRTHRHYGMPYAFVDPNGEWFAPGNVGWFAASDETADSYLQYSKCWRNFIKKAKDCYVSYTDLHI